MTFIQTFIQTTIYLTSVQQILADLDGNPTDQSFFNFTGVLNDKIWVGNIPN